MWCIDADGYIRVKKHELGSLCLVHLMSGASVDAVQVGDLRREGAPASGYTEWVTATQPAVSVGWDWTLEAAGTPVPKRRGSPYSNLMVVDADGRDVGPNVSADLLASLADQLAWQPAVLDAIGCRRA